MKIELSDDLTAVLLRMGDKVNDDPEVFSTITEYQDEKIEFYEAFNNLSNKIRSKLAYQKDIELSDDLAAVLLRMGDKVNDDPEVFSTITEYQDEKIEFYKAFNTLSNKIRVVPHHKRNAEEREKNRGKVNRKEQDSKTVIIKNLNIYFILDEVKNDEG